MKVKNKRYLMQESLYNPCTVPKRYEITILLQTLPNGKYCHNSDVMLAPFL